MAQAPDGPPSANPGKRCHVTLLFSDLCDYTALSESADPEDVAEVLHVTKSLAARVIEKHGGTLNQFYGDGLLAVFGLPHASEHDSRRAAEAALELHDALRSASFDLQLPAHFSTRMHSGIHAGLVFAQSSDARDGRYEIVGDPITTASRLCSAAGPDEILASEAALSGVAPFFEVEALTPLRLKGKLEPLPTFRVLRRAGYATRFEARAARGLTPFVGRERELGRLLLALDGVRGGAARLVHVTGDVGVGKTRLLDELAKRGGERAAFYTGASESYGHAAPLQPFLQIIEQAFELPRGGSAEEVRRRLAERTEAHGLAAHAPDLERLLGLSPRGDLGPEELAARDARVLTRIVGALSRAQPVCLILDDWHAADDASYRLLARLASALAEQPRQVLVITSSRSLDPRDPLAASAEHIELGPLSPGDAARAIDALLPHHLEVGVAESIRARSGGNPLFLEELCQAWPFAAREADVAGSPRVPSLLHGLIQARLERLPPELLRLARAAAVIGTDVEAWLLERIATEDDVAAGLERLAVSALVYRSERPGVYRFKHGVTREVVYDSVRIGERRRLHGAIAEAIEARFAGEDERMHCEALAHHYARADRPSRAAHFAALAGDKAASSSSLDRARLHYRAALRELDKLSSSASQRALWIDVSRKWAAACVYSPAPEQLEVLERALGHTRELGQAAAIAHSHYWLGWIHYALGDQARALGHTREALALAERIEQERLCAQLYANLGQIQLAAADAEASIAALGQAVASKHQQAQRASRGSLPVGFVYAVGCRGVARGYLGHFDEAYADLRSALHTVEGSGNAIEGSLLGLLAMVQLWQGHHGESVMTTERMLETAERVGGPYVYAMSRTIGGFARWMHERTPAALDELAAAVDWIERREMRLFHSFSLALAAEAFFSDQRWEAAERYARAALLRAEQHDRLGELAARRVLARCQARAPQRGSGPEELLEDARAIATARRSPRELWLTELARAECLPGDALEQQELGRRARRELAALGVRLWW